jgi:hypothetical protein
MQVGLSLSGTVADRSQPVAWLYRARQWLHEVWASTLVASEIRQSERGSSWLKVQLHPAAPELQISAYEYGRIDVSAQTSQVGPGYHAHVCELLRAMGNVLGIDWILPKPDEEGGDSTGYFFCEDRTRLEQVMLDAFGLAVRSALELRQQDGRQLALSLPETHTFSFEGAIATPLGPRNDQWLRSVAADPRRGRDVFPWWEPGQGGAYRLSRALTEMWTSVRWRKPITNGETAQLKRVLTLLGEAHGLNPALGYPWREWEELLSYAGEQQEVPEHPNDEALTLVGYRRRTVRVKLAGDWSICVPGSFAETWEDDGTYCGWDGSRTVWFSPQRISLHDPAQPAAELLPDLDAGERPVELPALPSGLARCAGVSEYAGDAGTVGRLNARMALPGRLVLFTVTFDRLEDLAWAVSVLESVRHPDG